MRRKTRKFAALVAVSGLALAASAPAASADPPRGQGYFKNVPSGGAGESECNGANFDALNAGQQKQCE